MTQDYVVCKLTPRTALRFWTRPLHAMTDAFTKAGFRISAISEPAVAPDTPREMLPDDFADRRRFVCFLFFVLKAVKLLRRCGLLFGISSGA